MGKTTQAALLSAWFEAIGLSHLVTREPGGTPVGEAIREVVLDRADLEMPAASELMLVLAARAAFVHDVVRPSLEAGTTVLADRFALSTLAYQGYGRGLDLDDIRAANEVATGGLSPDLYLVLDLPTDESLERGGGGRKSPDRIEREGGAFRDRVRDGYLALAASEPNVEVVSARGTPEEVHARIRDRVVARFQDALPVAGATDTGREG